MDENMTLEQAVHYAIARHQAGDLDTAQRAYEVILAQAPKDPNVLMNLGLLQQRRGNAKKAGQLLKQLMQYHPSLPQPYFAYGNLLMEQGRYRDAIAAFKQNLALQPDHANAHWNLAVCYLIVGDYARGLPHFEWRFASDHLKAKTRHFAQPRWLGSESLAGKTLLIYAEQGFGDLLQCARYFPQVAALGAKVMLDVPPAMLTLMQASFPNFICVSTGEAMPPFDVQCPVMSLPSALGVTLETLPNHVPYLTIPPERLQHWRARLGAKTRPRIGLVWAGAAHHANDHNRSIPLAPLAPLLQLPFEFHSLQKELRGDEEAYGSWIQNHSQELACFADTAALIAQMDLVISVDTSVAHLAGALGTPLWLLLPDPPDYRWLLTRTDSPLYPTARLFRQEGRTSDWSKVIQRVIEALGSDISFPHTRLF